MKILNHFEQGSLEWLKQRCGKITMSHAKELLTGGKGKTRQNYIMDVVAERLSGEPIEGYYGADMARGNFLEDWAIRAFEQHSGLSVDRVGFVLHDDERIGCSPDGLIGDDAGIEVKCPKPREHIRNMFASGMIDYMQQAQGCMWVCERPKWYVVSFCPWVDQAPLYVEMIHHDLMEISSLSRSAIAAADDVDAIVRNASEVDLSSDIKALSKEARFAWENAWAENSEVRV